MTDNQDDKRVIRPTQVEVHFKELSDTAESCATCRYNVNDDMCHLIENHPADLSQKSVCDKWDIRPGMVAPEPVAIIETSTTETEDKTAVMTEGFIAPKSNHRNFLETVKDKLLSGMKPGSTVFKDATGRRYMFIVTSNAYQDREAEWLTTEALKNYVDSCWVAEDYFHSDNSHLIWHHDDLAVGDIVWADMAGPFLVEVSKERDDIVSKAAWDYFETTDDALGASHRFAYRTSDRDSDGAYHAIKKIETTTLPLDAAANLLTYSGVLPMSESRDKYINGVFGLENAADLLRQGPQALAKALEENGVQHKAAADPVAETDEAETDFGALLLQMVEATADMAQRLDVVTQALDAEQKAMKALDEKLTAVADKNVRMQKEMAQAPRASQADNTIATDDEAAKAAATIANQMAKADPFWGDMVAPEGK